MHASRLFIGYLATQLFFLHCVLELEISRAHVEGRCMHQTKLAWRHSREAKRKYARDVDIQVGQKASLCSLTF